MAGEYTPTPLDQLTPEDLPLIIAQEFERVSERITSRQWSHAFKHITADYDAADEPYIFADATSGNITVSLPAPNEALIYNIKKTDSSANTVTLDGGTYNIDGATTYVISTQYVSITVYWATLDTPQWFIV